MQLLTLSEMADDLNLSAKTFSRDVREKSIPFHSRGKRKRFDPDEVKAYLKNWKPERRRLKASPSASVRVDGKGRFAEALGV